MGKKEATKVNVFIFSHLLLKDPFQPSSSTGRKFMTKLNLKIPMLKLHKSPRLSVKCGTTLTKVLRTDLKKSIKRTNKLPLRKSLIILKSMARLKKKKKKKQKGMILIQQSIYSQKYLSYLYFFQLLHCLSILMLNLNANLTSQN